MSTYKRNSKRLMEKAKKCTVIPLPERGVFKVISPSGADYHVDIKHPFKPCQCKWHEYHPDGVCSHMLAVELFLNPARYVSAWADEESAKRQHRHTEFLGDGVWITTRKKPA